MEIKNGKDKNICGVVSIHQFMDRNVLKLIIKNKPQPLKITKYTNIEKIAKKEVISKIKKFPKKCWYKNSATFYSIHGERHAFRVMVYSLLINHILRLNLDKKILEIASLLHDIRRDNDMEDDEHGIRSATWLRNNNKMLSSFFGVKTDWEYWRIIFTIVACHTLKLKDLNFLDRETLKYTQVLKAADALDRYRLKNVTAWIKDEYLAFKLGNDIKAFAFELVVFTEKKRIESLTLKETIECFL